MPKMEVIVVDTYCPNLQPGENYWYWPIDWEYVSSTLIPITDGNVWISFQYVGLAPGGVDRVLFATLFNGLDTPVDCFWTLTLPASSVA